MPRILVACKRVVDYAIKVRPTTDHLQVATTSLKHSINPFDEIALEEALRIKELISSSGQNHDNSEIIAVSIGEKSSGDLLRTALAIGADRAIHVNFSPAEGVYGIGSSNNLIAKCIASIAKREKVDLLLLGKQAIDDDSSQVGPLCAAYLDWPQATFASKIIINKNDYKKNVQVHREVDNGIQKVEFDLPAVITTDLRLNTPRYATLQNIMKAKTKPLQMETLESLLGLSNNNNNEMSSLLPSLQLESVKEPKKKQGSALILNSVDDLLTKLRGDGLIK